MNDNIYSTHLRDLKKGITTPVRVVSPFCSYDMIVQAVWDTGASYSCITTRVAQQLKLPPHRKATTETLSGTRETATTILLSFPGNQRYCTWIEATEADRLPNGCDMLIGLDVISLGEFHLRHNHSGELIFEFEFSKERFIDYFSDNAELTLQKIAKAYQDILLRREQ